MFLMSLSGGGYRAALFHAGVMRVVSDLGKLSFEAYDPVFINCVSGGAITGVIWDAYLGGSPPWREDNRLWPERQLLRLIEMSPLVGGRSRLSFRGYIPWLSWYGVLRKWWNEVRSSIPGKGWSPNVCVSVELLDVNHGNVFLANRDSIARPTRLFFKDGPGTWIKLKTETAIPWAIRAATAFPIYFSSSPALVPDPVVRGRAKKARFVDAGVIDNLGLLPFMPLFEKFQHSDGHHEIVRAGDEWFFSQAGRPMTVPDKSSSYDVGLNPVAPLKLTDRLFRLTGDLAQPAFEQTVHMLLTNHTDIQLTGCRTGVLPDEEPWLKTTKLTDSQSFATFKTTVNRIRPKDAVALIAHGAQTASQYQDEELRSRIRQQLVDLFEEIP